MASVKKSKVRDFVAIEFQTIDTTGTVWPERQRLLKALGFDVPKKDVDSGKPFGMNWKMTAKTILVQLHHKVDTLEHIGVYHPCAQDLDPAGIATETTSGAATDEAVDRHLDTGLNEGEVVAPKTCLSFLTKETAGELEESAL